MTAAREAAVVATPVDPERIPELARLEEQLGYAFDDRSLLELALVHRSFANENQRLGIDNNERLEFLGDAVLDLIVSERLMEVAPEASEGDLTRMRAAIVNTAVLGGLAARRGIGEALRLGRGEVATGGREKSSVLADAFEAVLAAVYLDGGMEAARRFVVRHLRSAVYRACREGGTKRDAKTRLQEILQEGGRGTPRYVTVAEEGPDHCKTFTVEIHVGGEGLGRGKGGNKKEAAQAAARAVLRRLEREEAERAAALVAGEAAAPHP